MKAKQYLVVSGISIIDILLKYNRCIFLYGKELLDETCCKRRIYILLQYPLDFVNYLKTELRKPTR